MESKKIREDFLKFFEGKGHKIVKSSSLIPFDDPTLLFTNAGMVQFKKFWATDIPLPYTRATSCQKCLRAGGKDSDLEKIGESGKHHTFFEMLGNFSFGDYFKKEAIEWAFEFVVEKLKIPEDKLWISYFKEDLETKEIWKKFLPEEKLVPLGEKDNFWGPAGDTGPCGPCTEIYYDFGKEKGCGKPDCKPGCNCERFLEFWNLVFPQYDKQSDGSLLPLKRRGVDTGMGLERIARIMQKVETNYDTDLFIPIIKKIEEITGFSYRENKRNFRIISDHIRGIVFAIADGVFPSNEGRGYVLRRIIRRGCLSGLDLNVKEPFLFRLSEIVINMMSEFYPELYENRNIIEKVIQEEEERFYYLISSSRKIFLEITRKEKEEKLKGEIVFKLYDTYGIPKDLIEELAFQNNKKIDWAEFEKFMEKQKEISKIKSKIGIKKKEILISDRIIETEFTGYEKLSEISKLSGVFEGEGNTYLLVFEKTPFYPEKGGQIGDKGIIYNEEGFKFEVIDTQIDENGLIYHIGKIKDGKIEKLKIGEKFFLEVDSEFRKKISINHTSTHLLHYALREIIGKEVRQAGSYVGDDKLRFDFVCFSELDEGVIKKIEELIYKKIFEKVDVRTEIMTINEAIEKGAIALFTEKYGEKVRVVSTGDFHKEVCGGTHLKNTGDIFLFHITSFSTIGKNLKRIEAITYKNCLEYFLQSENNLKNISKLLKSESEKVYNRIEKLIEELENKKKEIEKYLNLEIERITEQILKTPEIILKENEEIKFFVGKIKIIDKENVGKIADKIVEREKNSLVFLISEADKENFFVFKISNNLIKNFSAIKIIKNLSKYIRGGGNEKFVSGVLEKNINGDFIIEEVKRIVKNE
ncbi:MAG: alanine--tRNA ligase [Candidatus Omnitrophica bacterium]|nr:alanine--tRNA ligase [Candidatus Omnitrophota bacterium]